MIRLKRNAAFAVKIMMVAALCSMIWTDLGWNTRKAEALAMPGDAGSWTFEDDLLSQSPAGWSATSNGSLIVAADPLNVSNQTMKLQKSATSAAFTASALLNEEMTAVTIRARVLPSQISGTNAALYAPYLKDSAGTTFASLNWYPNGQLAINHSGTIENLAVVDTQQWQEIAVTADVNGGTFDVYLNGELVKSDAAFRAGVQGIAEAMFGMSGTMSGSAYIDDVEIYSFSLFNRVIHDQFDLSPINQLPAGWTANAYGTAAVQEVSSDARYLRLQTSSPTASFLATRAFPEESGELVVRTRFRPGSWAGSGGAFYGPYLKDGNGTTFASINWTTNGMIAINQGSSSQTIESYSPTEWYEVELVLDTDNQKFDLYINGERKRSGVPFRASSSGLGSVVFGAYTGTSGSADIAEVAVIRKQSTHLPVTGIALHPSSIAMDVKGRTVVTAALAPSNAANQRISWSSSNDSVAEVRPLAEGLSAEVHAGATPGTATITATSEDGGFQASAVVTTQFRPVQTSIYVAPGGDDNNPGTAALPFQTLERARDAARLLNTDMTGDIHVVLREGVYTLTETLAFDERDSGSNGYDIVYRAYDGETPIISGGKSITGWTLHDASRNIYKASAGSDIETRQLFVNGKRAIRARSEDGLPGHSMYTTTNQAHPYRTPSGLVRLGHRTSWSDMAAWGNQQDIEMVYKAIWTNPRVGVESISLDGSGQALITMKQPGFFYATNKGATSVQAPWYIENAYELLDEEGEWYLDRATDIFYYKPRTGELMNTAEVVAPVLETLLLLEGDSLDDPVSHIRFEGLSFQHTTWLRPNGDNGHSDAQNNVIRERYTVDGSPSYDDYPKYPEWIDEHAAVVLRKAANHIVFERNHYSVLGHIGILMLRGSQDNLVRGNVFIDISAQGVQVGGDDYDRGIADYFYPDDERKLLRNNDVLHNYFEKVAVEYRSAAAIGASYPVDMNIENNTMIDLPYSGIHVGWGWSYIGGPNQGQTGSVPSAEPPPTGGNHIRFNRIVGVMQDLVDGGAIYTLGRQSSASYITDNYILEQQHEFGAIYPDEGSNLYTIRNNVMEDIVRWLHIHTGSVRDNIITGNHTDTGALTFNGTNNTLSGNMVVRDGNWSPQAIAIRESAGVGEAYAGILP